MLSRLRLKIKPWSAVSFGHVLSDSIGCGYRTIGRDHGDSSDNALNESNNALYKAEMVRPQGGFNGTADLKWARLLSIDWLNN